MTPAARGRSFAPGPAAGAPSASGASDTICARSLAISAAASARSPTSSATVRWPASIRRRSRMSIAAAGRPSRVYRVTAACFVAWRRTPFCGPIHASTFPRSKPLSAPSIHFAQTPNSILDEHVRADERPMSDWRPPWDALWQRHVVSASVGDVEVRVARWKPQSSAAEPARRPAAAGHPKRPRARDRSTSRRARDARGSRSTGRRSPQVRGAGRGSLGRVRPSPCGKAADAAAGTSDPTRVVPAYRQPTRSTIFCAAGMFFATVAIDRSSALNGPIASSAEFFTCTLFTAGHSLLPSAK